MVCSAPEQIRGAIVRGLVGVVVVMALAGCEADGRPSKAWGAALEGFSRGLNGPDGGRSSQPVRSAYEVTCATHDRNDQDGRIDALGGPRFYAPLDEAIRAVENGTRLYTKVLGRDANLSVAEQSFPRQKYLRTDADGFGQNNLMSLPDCR